MKSSASSKYNNKFMFNNHPQQHPGDGGFVLNRQAHMAVAAAAAAAKSKEQHFMQSYFQSQKNMNHKQHAYAKGGGSLYGSGQKDVGGSSSMSESEQKQIRRLRSTQSMPPANPCGCSNRSKSMEDIRDLIVDWTVSPKSPSSVVNGGVSPKQKLNNDVRNNNGNANSYFMNNNKLQDTYGYNNNTKRRFIANANYIINGQLANIKNKNNMRRSMDNLLEIETNFTQNFQVDNIILSSSRDDGLASITLSQAIDLAYRNLPS